MVGLAVPLLGHFCQLSSGRFRDLLASYKCVVIADALAYSLS